ncbi:MAG: N-acetylglucosamine kinase [Galactobacter sp.]
MPLPVIAIDAGQTGVRIRVDVPAGAALAAEPSEYPGVRTSEPLAPQLARYVVRQLGHLGAQPHGVIVAIGSTGVADVPGLAREIRELLDTLDVPGARLSDRPHVAQLYVAHDSVTSYLGALGNRNGVVVAAGTGSITLGVGPDSTARVDGWGYFLGDDGSGFAIGKNGWRAVMRHVDGRGPATALTEDFRGDYPDLTSAYVGIQNDPDRVRLMASYARRVTALAGVDEVAAGIARDAGAELAHSVVTAAHRVGLSGEVLVAELGKVLTDPTVAAAFREGLQVLDSIRVVEAAGSGLDGAAALPTVTGALQHLVATA